MTLLQVKVTADKGSGVYTSHLILPGFEVLQFKGEVLDLSSIGYPIPPEEDHYIQIGERTFLGPSGEMDDLVNHSCNPNCGVTIMQGRVALKAIRLINKDEEVTYDYSTTSTLDPRLWSMTCACGHRTCRRLISGFHTVPKDIQEDYMKRKIVPTYVVDHFNPLWMGLN